VAAGEVLAPVIETRQMANVKKYIVHWHTQRNWKDVISDVSSRSERRKQKVGTF
jgi:hypothetical protein